MAFKCASISGGHILAFSTKIITTKTKRRTATTKTTIKTIIIIIQFSSEQFSTKKFLGENNLVKKKVLVKKFVGK